MAASGSGNIGAFTATNATATNVTATITVTPKFTFNSVTCSGTAQTFTITVNPTPTANDPIDQTVCNGSLTTAIAFTGTGTSYDWTNNTTSIGLAASGTGNIGAFTATNATATNVTATITVTPKFTFNSVTCSGSAQTFTIPVNPTPTVNDPTDQTVCNGSLTTAINFTGTGTSYDWTNNTPSIGLGASGSGNIAAFTATNSSATNVTATITVTPKFTFNSVTCSGTAQTFSITVNPTPTVNDPTDQTVCNGSSTTAINFTGTGTSYDWTNNTTSIGLAASGTGNIAAFTATNSGSTIVTATITVTPKFTFNSVTCAGTAQTFTITVNPTPTVNDPTDQTVCNGSLTTPVTFVGTGTSYDWANNTPSIGLGASGTGNIAAFTATNATATNVTATITVTPKFTFNSVTCSGTAQTFTVTVNPTPTVNDPADQTICNGGSTTAITFTGTGTSYDWTNNTPSIGLGASGSGNIAAFSATNATATNVTATITVTPKFTFNSVTCSGTAQTFIITVNPTPTVNDPTDQTVCNGSLTTPVTFVGTGTSYDWTNNTPSIGLGASGSGNIAAFSAINATATNVTATITVTPKFTFNSVTCSGTAQTFAITVNPTPSVNDPTDQTVCNGSSTTAITFTGSGTSYDWTNNTPSIGLAASGSGNIAAFTATNSGATNVTATITVTPKFTFNAVTCSGTAQTFTITVNPTPTVNDPTDQTVCNGSNTTAITFAGTGTSYDWTNNTPSIGLAASGSGNIAAFSATNSGVTNVTATITVTPKFNSCNGTPQTFTITVNPSITPVVTLVSNPTGALCSGTSVTFTATPTNTGGGTVTYNFKVNGVSKQNNSSATFTTSSLANGNAVTVTINITGGQCLTSQTATSSPINVIVNPIPAVPTITQGTATIICSGGTIPLTSSSNLGNQWHKDGVAINNATSQTYIANANGNYTAKVTVNGCTSVASNVISVLFPTIPPPTFISFTPTSGLPGTEVVITGTNFSPIPTDNIVLFNGVPATVISGSTTYLTVIVPEGAESGTIIVKYCNQADASPTIFIVPDTTIQINDLITPFNNDGMNDQFKIVNIEFTFSNKVILLDRYGVVIKEWKDFRNYDDPNNPNPDAFDFAQFDEGNYICILQYQMADGGAMEKMTQVITILK